MTAAAPFANPADMLDVLRTGPLALDAAVYWQHLGQAEQALWALGWIGLIGPNARRLLLSQALEAIEGLVDLAESGHPAIRARAAARVPALKSRLSAFVEQRP